MATLLQQEGAVIVSILEMGEAETHAPRPGHPTGTSPRRTWHQIHFLVFILLSAERMVKGDMARVESQELTTEYTSQTAVGLRTKPLHAGVTCLIDSLTFVSRQILSLCCFRLVSRSSFRLLVYSFL